MKIFRIMILAVVTISCATQKQAENSTTSFIKIKFGSSGGFTGMTHEYLIKNDGKVYKNTSDNVSLIVKFHKVVKLYIL
jgi:hypothetical protein